MRFVAFTPFQAALLSVLTAGAIIALYSLKVRYRRVSISSSMLWRRVLEEKKAHSLWERLRKIISIAMAVTIALLIALSIGRPEIEALTGKTPRIVVVLDTSPSMNARTADGRTRWQHAVAQARTLVDSGGAAAEVRIADTSGETAFPFTTDHAEARAMLNKLSPEGAEPRFPKVDSRDSMVYFVSDGVGLRDVPAFVERLSVFEPAPNVAITAFDVRPMPSNPLGYEAYLEVQNYGQAVDVGMTLTGTADNTISSTISLAAGEKFKESFDLSNFRGGSIRASIQSKDDALPDDDVAFAYLPIKRRTRTLLVTRGNNYLTTLLKVNPYVELQTTDPGNFRELPEIDAYVFDRFAPSTAPAKPALIFGAPAADWLRQPQGVVQKPEITSWSDDHPIMQHVSVHDISIKQAARIDAMNLTVVAASNQTPLIVASEKPRWVMLTFDLNASDFPLQVGSPVFVDNVLAWFNREQLAMRRPTGTVEVPLANADVRTADGKTIPSQQQLGKTVFHVNEAGLYMATQGEARVPVAVNLANAALSNINQSTFKTGAPTTQHRISAHNELWVYMLLGAVVLISVEWLTYHRRITL